MGEVDSCLAPSGFAMHIEERWRCLETWTLERKPLSLPVLILLCIFIFFLEIEIERENSLIWYSTTFLYYLPKNKQ